MYEEESYFEVYDSSEYIDDSSEEQSGYDDSSEEQSELSVTPISDSSEYYDESSEEDLELAVTTMDDSSAADDELMEVDRQLDAGEEVVPIAIDALVELIQLHNQKEESADSQIVENITELNARVYEVETISLVSFASAFCVIGVVFAVKFSRWFFRFF